MTWRDDDRVVLTAAGEALAGGPSADGDPADRAPARSRHPMRFDDLPPAIAAAERAAAFADLDGIEFGSDAGGLGWDG